MRFHISHRGHLYIVTSIEELLAFHRWFEEQDAA